MPSRPEETPEAAGVLTAASPILSNHVVDEGSAVIHHVADRAVLITQASEGMAGAVVLRDVWSTARP